MQMGKNYMKNKCLWAYFSKLVIEIKMPPGLWTRGDPNVFTTK